ncbi:MAG: hypothetical protein OES35_05265 [Chromatiales bacterium]|jgi:hypothetical protein|nr:hypothetical protein [Chromatiales bacterium]
MATRPTSGRIGQRVRFDSERRRSIGAVHGNIGRAQYPFLFALGADDPEAVGGGTLDDPASDINGVTVSDLASSIRRDSMSTSTPFWNVPSAPASLCS